MAASEVKIRNAFLKIEEDSGYVPLDYPDNYIARDENDEAISVRWDGDLERMRRCNGDVNAAADLLLSGADLGDALGPGPSSVRVPTLSQPPLPPQGSQQPVVPSPAAAAR